MKFAAALGYVNSRVLLAIPLLRHLHSTRSHAQAVCLGSPESAAQENLILLGSSRHNPAVPGPIREAILTTLFREFFLFLHQNKKLWLLPIVAVMLLLGALLVLAQGSALAPFIYTLF